MNQKLQAMLDKKAHIMLQGGQEKINKQHAKGKLTARERINLLFDPGTFVEYNMFVKPRATRFGMDKVDAPADGIITGHGLINGRKAFAYAQDATVLGGSMGCLLYTSNLGEYMIEAVSAYATLGEICEVLKKVYGKYTPMKIY